MTLDISKSGGRVGLSFDEADPFYLDPTDFKAYSFNGDVSLEIEYVRRGERKYESIALGSLTINGESPADKQSAINALALVFPNAGSAATKTISGWRYVLQASDNGSILFIDYVSEPPNVNEVGLPQNGINVPDGLPIGFTCRFVNIGNGLPWFVSGNQDGSASETNIRNRHGKATYFTGRFAVAELFIGTDKLVVVTGDLTD